MRFKSYLSNQSQTFLLSLLIAFLSIVVSPSSNAAGILFNTPREEPKQSTTYGEFLIEYAFYDLGSRLEPLPGNPEGLSGRMNKEQQEIVNKLYDMWYKFMHHHRAKNQSQFYVFKSGDDPIFQLNSGEPSRTAVTSSEISDSVYFNLERINDRENFNYGKALSLWIHELGHKIEKTSQYDLDSIATLFEVAFKNREIVFPSNNTDEEVAIINHMNLQYLMSGEMADPSIALIREGKLIHLDHILFGWKESKRWSHSQGEWTIPTRFANAWINHVETVKLEDDLYSFNIDFVASSIEKQSEDSWLQEAPHQIRVNFVVQIDDEDHKNSKLMDFHYLNTYMPRPAPFIETKVKFDMAKASEGFFEIEVKMKGEQDVAHILGVSRLHVMVDGQTHGLYFDSPHFEPSIDVEFKANVEFPEELYGETIEVLGIVGQAYLPQPLRDQQSWDLGYLFTLDEPAFIEIPAQGTSGGCGRVLE